MASRSKPAKLDGRAPPSVSDRHLCHIGRRELQGGRERVRALRRWCALALVKMNRLRQAVYSVCLAVYLLGTENLDSDNQRDETTRDPEDHRQPSAFGHDTLQANGAAHLLQCGVVAAARTCRSATPPCGPRVSKGEDMSSISVGQHDGVSVGVYAGSFDPLHLGHVGVIEDASCWLDRLYVVVAGNPAKGIGLLSMETRRGLLAGSVAHIPNVDAVSYSGLIVDFAAVVSAEVLIRASGRERGSEWAMSQTNQGLSGIKTVFVTPRSATRGISSRWIRDTIRTSGANSVVEFVPAPVADALAAL